MKDVIFLLGALSTCSMACTDDTGSATDANGMESSAPSDASDASACPKGTRADLDQQIAIECANRHYGLGDASVLNVWVSTGVACGGFLVLVVQDGIDTETLYLYDPATKKLVEVASGANGDNRCVTSADGISIACYMTAYGPTPSGFIDACADTSSDASTDGASE